MELPGSNADNSKLDLLIREAEEGRETVFDFMDVGGESVKQVAIERRKLQPELPDAIPEAPLASAAARNHTFHDVDALIDYLRFEQSPSVLVLADVKSRSFSVVLNEKENPTDREVLYLSAIEHPLFLPWKGILDQATEATEFALFAMKHRRAIVKPDGREVAMVFQQIKMSKSIEVKAGVGAKALNGVMVETVIAGETQSELMELPESLKIDVPLFLGSDPQEVDIDLVVTERNGSPVVYATAADVEEQQCRAFEKMCERIKEADIPNMVVGLGSVSSRSWKRLAMQDELEA